MRSSRSIARIGLLPVSIAALVVALLASPGAIAQAAGGGTDSWQFGLGIYGWFPDLSGETAFTQPGGTNDFKVDIDTILENLAFIFMGTFDMHKGRWGIFTDVIYMDIEGSESGTRQATIGGSPLPVNAAAEVNLDMESWVWTFTGYYRAFQRNGTTLDLLAGARYLDVNQTLNWNVTGNVGSIPVPDRAGNATADLSNWDGLVGVRGRIAFGAKGAWFVPYYLDVGAGDSDLTWQGVAGLGYSFGWWEVAGVWRYLYYDLGSGSAIQDTNFNGPAVGVTFRW